MPAACVSPNMMPLGSSSNMLSVIGNRPTGPCPCVTMSKSLELAESSKSATEAGIGESSSQKWGSHGSRGV